MLLPKIPKERRMRKMKTELILIIIFLVAVFINFYYQFKARKTLDKTIKILEEINKKYHLIENSKGEG